MLWPRWLFLRALGLIFASAFFSLLFQMRGLVGPEGIEPAGSYLRAVAGASPDLPALPSPSSLPALRHLWEAPTVLWAGTGPAALTALVAAGLAAAVLLTLNVWPRLAAALATLAFLSCVATLQDFSAYQSDGMLLQAGVAGVLLAPRGVFPGLGVKSPPPRAGIWLLRWEWFAIYFESGLVKLLSGDPQWRTLTAMDHYYENNPLPTWIGWYVQQLPHLFHAATTLLTLVMELVAPWAVFLWGRARPVRVAIAIIVTVFQLGIIGTANYAFLNYLVLALGVFLVGDRDLERWRALRRATPSGGVASLPPSASAWRVRPVDAVAALTFVGTVYVGAVSFLPTAVPGPLLAPARWAAPFRVANAYGLFAVMTRARYEIEFQGTRDDTTWIAYPFRYKPQDPATPPGIYAPYQPRFDWNLWFASLAPWTDNPWVVAAQARLLTGSPSVLELFAGDPFAAAPPRAVRTVVWRYWFTDAATRRRTGRWWNRTFLGLYAGTVRRDSAGTLRFEPRR